MMDAGQPRAARWALCCVTLFALALRAWPLHVPYLHPDQEFIPGMAVRALAAGSWEPESLYTMRRGVKPHRIHDRD